MNELSEALQNISIHSTDMEITNITTGYQADVEEPMVFKAQPQEKPKVAKKRLRWLDWRRVRRKKPATQKTMKKDDPKDKWKDIETGESSRPNQEMLSWEKELERKLALGDIIGPADETLFNYPTEALLPINLEPVIPDPIVHPRPLPGALEEWWTADCMNELSEALQNISIHSTDMEITNITTGYQADVEEPMVFKAQPQEKPKVAKKRHRWVDWRRVRRKKPTTQKTMKKDDPKDKWKGIETGENSRSNQEMLSWEKELERKLALSDIIGPADETLFNYTAEALLPINLEPVIPDPIVHPRPLPGALKELMDTSDTGDSDTTGPLPMVSDDIMSSEHEVHTSDYTSTDDDDFQPFALPDGADEPIVGDPAEDLPLVAIPAPIPLASYPAYELMQDAEADDDIDLFEDEPFEDEDPDPALLPAGGLLMIAGAPVGDSPVHSPVPDSFESVASVPSQEASTPHFVHDSDPDQASSAAPMPSFVFEHEDIEDSDPIFPPGFDPDRDIEYVPMDPHVEDPVDPADHVGPIDPDFDFDMAFDDQEPAVAPEQAAAFDPVHEHGLVHADVPVDPVLADPPVGDFPIDDVPLLDADHAADPLVDPPLIDDVPVDPHVDHVDPVIAPVDPLPIEPEHALFAEHMDPPDEEAQHGLMDTSDTGDSDTTGPLPMVSDDIMSSEHEVHTSDYTSTDDDDFQPFALPDGADEPIVGDPAEDLPLVAIPAPIPLASYPAYELMQDAEADDDIDLFEDEPFEDEDPDPALLPAGGLLMIAGAPVGDSPVHSPVPDSFESVASVPSQEASTPHFVHDSDPDQASSAAPMPSFVFEHEDIEDSDPIFPPGFDPDRDIEYVPMDPHVEDPVDPADHVGPIDPDFDFDMAFDDQEPAVAPEQAAAFDPVHEHGLVHADVPVDPVFISMDDFA
ncbi:uncharacterized protein LOC110902360 [Helianthus annuus]|uniref:uncharacterized protein LOC110902360 n=1 Tax=Helianthus annuus TaxID=4232 RepID=UPI000B8F597F|nr:uncharacterized protein LOC110902360 [Helianthus annuus]